MHSLVQMQFCTAPFFGTLGGWEMQGLSPLTVLQPRIGLQGSDPILQCLVFGTRGGREMKGGEPSRLASAVNWTQRFRSDFALPQFLDPLVD